MTLNDEVARNILTEKANLLLEPTNPKVGMHMTWKPGMQNKKSQGPFVVLEVLDPAIFSPGVEASSPYFREPLDVICGRIDPSDGDFMVFHYDSRRFQELPDLPPVV
jgi:hypothetical protein